MHRFLVIGSHVVALLLDHWAAVMVGERLSTGHRAAVLPGSRFMEAVIAGAPTLDTVRAAEPGSYVA